MGRPGGYFLAMTVGGWILAYLPWYYVFLIPFRGYSRDVRSGPLIGQRHA